MAVTIALTHAPRLGDATPPQRGRRSYPSTKEVPP
jgi:hypothetical protein